MIPGNSVTERSRKRYLIMPTGHRRLLIRPIRGAHSDAVFVKRLGIREIGVQRGVNSFNFIQFALWLKK
jgi:hypothetical protein